MAVIEDDTRLEEYIKSLSPADKELVPDLPLDDIDALIDMGYDELAQIRDKPSPTPNFRRLEIIEEIMRLHALAVIEQAGKRHLWAKGVSINENKSETGNTKARAQPQGTNEEQVTIEQATEAVLSIHDFATLKENDVIYAYNNAGLYHPGGEVIMRQALEEMFGYKINRNKFGEVCQHVRNKTYKSITEFDADLNIINLQNGFYNIKTGELQPHSPKYLSLNQKPITYDKSAPLPTRFIEFVRQIVYPSEIRTLLELMAYTFWRDNPFEMLTMLFGNGSNGKSVLFGIIAALHGDSNVSNVSLKTIIERPFGPYDLVGKDVNLDSELSSSMITESAIMKKIRGRQPTRVEQKGKAAFDTRLHAKLWFSANKIPETTDDTDAFHRRVRIISFPNTFQEGTTGYDPDLIAKLTTPESLAGIFNLLMPMLRRILRNKGIYLADKTIEARRQKYEIAVNPVRAFLDTANMDEALESDTITKEMLYKAYEHFCKQNKLAIMYKAVFGKRVTKEGIQSYRETYGERRTLWQGIRLTREYENAAYGFYGKQANLGDSLV